MFASISVCTKFVCYRNDAECYRNHGEHGLQSSHYRGICVTTEVRWHSGHLPSAGQKNVRCKSLGSSVAMENRVRIRTETLVIKFLISQWEHRLHRKEQIALSVTYTLDLRCFMNTGPVQEFQTIRICFYRWSLFVMRIAL